MLASSCVSLDGLRCLPHNDKTVSALLIETAEARMVLLQSGQCPQCIRDPAQISLGNGHKQLHITVVSYCGKQRFSCGQRFGKFPLSEQRANPGCFGSNH